MEEITRFYQTEGPKIFPKRTGVRGWLGRVQNVFRPKFTDDALRAAIKEVVGDRLLKEAKTRPVIPSYDVNTGKVYLFKTPHHPGYMNHADLPAVDAALTTSAAPTYFSRRTRFPAGARSSTGASGPTARPRSGSSRRSTSSARPPSRSDC